MFAPTINYVIGKSINKSIVVGENTNKGSVFPNPAKEYVEFSYTLSIGAEEGKITLANVSGVVVHQQQLSAKYGQVAIDTRQWQESTYVYSLTAIGKTVSSQKFVVYN